MSFILIGINIEIICINDVYIYMYTPILGDLATPRDVQEWFLEEHGGGALWGMKDWTRVGSMQGFNYLSSPNIMRHFHSDFQRDFTRWEFFYTFANTAFDLLDTAQGERLLWLSPAFSWCHQSIFRLLAVYMSSLVRCLFRSSPIFNWDCFPVVHIFCISTPCM